MLLFYNKEKRVIGGKQMRCGAKCFLVEIEAQGEKQMMPITARTPAEARKRIRLEYGAEASILSVKEEKKPSNA